MDVAGAKDANSPPHIPLVQLLPHLTKGVGATSSERAVPAENLRQRHAGVKLPNVGVKEVRQLALSMSGSRRQP